MRWVVAAAAVFLGLKLPIVGPRLSDENLYFYHAAAFLQGATPYRDLFLANLPGQTLLYASVMRLGGGTVGIKLLTLLLTIGTGLVIFRIFSDEEKERAGILAAVLFLFSSLVLTVSDFAIGAMEAVFLLVLSWYWLPRRPFVSGILLFLAIVMRVWVAAAALGIGFGAVVSGKGKQALISFGVALLLFLVLNFRLYAVFGEDFLTSAWKYHFLKPETPLGRRAFVGFLQHEKFLFPLAAAVLLPLHRQGKKGRKLAEGEQRRREALFAVCGQLAFLLLLPTAFLIYFVALVPFLALLAGTAMSSLRRSALGAVFVGLVVLVNGFSYRQIGARRYRIPQLSEMVSQVQAAADEGETLFGNYLLVPLLALESGRSITEWQADTSTLRVYSGLLSQEEMTRLAARSAIFVQSVVLEEGNVRRADPQVGSEALVTSCTPLRVYPLEQDFGFNAVVFWRCGEG